jgi:hypothetical protein
MAIPANVFTPNVEAKAAEIVAAGSVRKYHGEWPTWRVKGTTGEYTVRWWVAKKKWTCDCPANGACCSHIRAAQLSEEQKEAEPVGAWAGLAFPEVCDTSACERFQACHGRNKKGECPKNHCSLDVEDGCPPCVTCPSSRHNQSSKVAVAPPNEKETNNMAHDEQQTAMVAAPAQRCMSLGMARMSLEEKKETAQYLLESGMIPKHLDTPAKIIVTMMVAEELGVATYHGLTKLYVVDNKVTAQGELMLAMVRNTRAYGYRFVENTDEKATFEIWPYAHPDEKYTCSYTMEFAKAHKWDLQEWYDKSAGRMQSKPKQPWIKFPGHMLKWRCVSDAVRVVCPEVIGGMYTPEELGAPVWVQEDGSVEVVAEGPGPDDATPTAPAAPPKRAPRAKKTPEAPPAAPVDPDPIEGVFDATDAPAGGTVERLEDLAEGDETEAAAPAADEEGVTDAEIVPEDQPWFQYGPTGGPANEHMKVYMVQQGLWEAEDALDLPEEDDDAGEEESAGDAGADDPLELTDEEAALCSTGTAGDISKWIGEHKGDLGGMGRDALKEAAGHGDKTWAQIQKDEHREEIFTMILTVAKAKMQEAKGG